jgi:ribosome maturation protein Sdo1
MPRGLGQQTKVHYKGAADDFIIFVDNEEIVAKWKQDKTVPLSDVVSGWKVFVTHK